jgi:Sec-independent protein translocase protein TatA
MLSSTETLLVVAIVYALLFAAGRLANGEDERPETPEATDP